MRHLPGDDLSGAIRRPGHRIQLTCCRRRSSNRGNVRFSDKVARNERRTRSKSSISRKVTVSFIILEQPIHFSSAEQVYSNFICLERWRIAPAQLSGSQHSVSSVNLQGSGPLMSMSTWPTVIICCFLSKSCCLQIKECKPTASPLCFAPNSREQASLGGCVECSFPPARRYP